MIDRKALQDMLMRQYRAQPINPNQDPDITAVERNLITKAYAHLCKRANAWDGVPNAILDSPKPLTSAELEDIKNRFLSAQRQQTPPQPTSGPHFAVIEEIQATAEPDAGWLTRLIRRWTRVLHQAGTQATARDQATPDRGTPSSSTSHAQPDPGETPPTPDPAATHDRDGTAPGPRPSPESQGHGDTSPSHHTHHTSNACSNDRPVAP